MAITTLRAAAHAAVATLAMTSGLALASPTMASARSYAPPRPTPTHHARTASATHHAHAAAASGCTSAGPTETDFRGVRYGTRYCHNYHGGGLRLAYSASSGYFTSGYLYAGTNWFVCQQRLGENPTVGGARNNIWLYTQGDVSYSSRSRGWGWFPATYLSGGVNYGPIPGLRWC